MSFVNERLEALEERLDNLDESLIDLRREENRQARWHATRDAALQGYVHAGVTAEYSRDDVLRWATEFADRAHGPLAGKPVLERLDALGYAARLFKVYAPQCEPLDTIDGVLTQLDNLLTGMVKREDLNALVKASEAIDKTALSQALTAEQWKELVMNLRAALQPFKERT